MAKNNNSEMTRKDLETQLVAKAWDDETFRQQLISNPKAVIEQEFGKKISENIKVEIIEEPLDTRYIVLPTKLKTGDELDEEELEAVAGGLSRRLPMPLYGGAPWGNWFLTRHY